MPDRFLDRHRPMNLNFHLGHVRLEISPVAVYGTLVPYGRAGVSPDRMEKWTNSATEPTRNFFMS
jgi:hypothetical protein